mmetsp:Transcript_2784/g.8315  ORF Transcript_2784/g.8315 Transcript_2784/m.8315 type:complete len:360 (+) Transcript_2784:241-1320(+)
MVLLLKLHVPERLSHTGVGRNRWAFPRLPTHYDTYSLSTKTGVIFCPASSLCGEFAKGGIFSSAAALFSAGAFSAAAFFLSVSAFLFSAANFLFSAANFFFSAASAFFFAAAAFFFAAAAFFFSAAAAFFSAANCFFSAATFFFFSASARFFSSTLVIPTFAFHTASCPDASYAFKSLLYCSLSFSYFNSYGRLFSGVMSFQRAAAIFVASTGFKCGFSARYSPAYMKYADPGFLGLLGGRSQASFLPESTYSLYTLSNCAFSFWYASSHGRFSSGFINFHLPDAVFITVTPFSLEFFERKSWRKRSQAVVGFLGLSGSLTTGFVMLLTCKLQDAAPAFLPPPPTSGPVATVRLRAGAA